MAALTEPQKLWLEDLRNHPELQGRGRLKTEDGKYCCLGRGCVVFNENSGIHILEDTEGFDHTTFNLPSKVYWWLNFIDGLQERCVDWNDNIKLTFPEIADKAETYWKSL